jgi:hypothetical protein
MRLRKAVMTSLLVEQDAERNAPARIVALEQEARRERNQVAKVDVEESGCPEDDNLKARQPCAFNSAQRFSSIGLFPSESVYTLNWLQFHRGLQKVADRAVC